MTLTEQFITMFAMICVGLFIGISYDTYLRFSSYWKQLSILSFMLEIAFWFIQTFILFFVLLDVHDGQLRWYVFAACLLGVSIYYVALQKIYRYILNKLILLIQTLFKYIVIIPVGIIIQVCFFILQKAYQLIYAVIRIVLLIIFKPIFAVFSRIFRLMPEKVQKSFYKLRDFYCIIRTVAKKSWHWLCTKFGRGE